MKQQTYDDEILTRYLLGSHSEEETERLDELSFTDDDLAARLQAIENDLVDAYVRGEISGQTLERFNSYYLSSPARREKVAIARGLQELTGRVDVNARADQQQRTLAESSVPDRPASRKGFLRGYFFVPRSAPQWGLAAIALMMIVAGGWLAFENLSLRDQANQHREEREELQRRERELQAQLQKQGSSDSEKEQELASLREQIARLERQSIEQKGAKTQTPLPAEPNVIPFTLAPQTRGANQIITISIPGDADYVMMQLELEPGDFASYRAELRAGPGNEVVWRSGRLRARARGESKAVVVTLRPAIFKSQIYTLEVYGASPAGASEIIGSYPFRVVK